LPVDSITAHSSSFAVFLEFFSMSALPSCRLLHQKIYVNNTVFFCNVLSASDFGQLNWHWSERCPLSSFYSLLLQ